MESISPDISHSLLRASSFLVIPQMNVNVNVSIVLLESAVGDSTRASDSGGVSRIFRSRWWSVVVSSDWVSGWLVDISGRWIRRSGSFNRFRCRWSSVSSYRLDSVIASGSRILRRNLANPSRLTNRPRNARQVGKRVLGILIRLAALIRSINVDSEGFHMSIKSSDSCSSKISIAKGFLGFDAEGFVG